LAPHASTTHRYIKHSHTTKKQNKLSSDARTYRKKEARHATYWERRTSGATAPGEMAPPTPLLPVLLLVAGDVVAGAGRRSHGRGLWRRTRSGGARIGRRHREAATTRASPTRRPGGSCTRTTDAARIERDGQ